MFTRSIGLELLRRAAAARMLPDRARPALFRLSGMTIGAEALIMSGLYAPKSGRIKIGRNVFLNYDVYLDAQAEIVIEDRVFIADHVRVVTSTHEIAAADRRAGRSYGLPVRIGAGAWLGSGSTVLPGVHVAEGCIVAAGAVVSSSTDANGLYAGVPARRLRDL